MIVTYNRQIHAVGECSSEMIKSTEHTHLIEVLFSLILYLSYTHTLSKFQDRSLGDPVTFPADTFDLTDGASGEPAPPHPLQSLTETQNFINPVASCLVPAA